MLCLPCFFFIDDAFDDILDFILLQFCNFINRTALVAMLLDDSDIFEIIDLWVNDIFLEMWHFYL